jgi:hypothetical protein
LVRPDRRHDAATLEASAALRSIVRQDTGESEQDFLTKLLIGLSFPAAADVPIQIAHLGGEARAWMRERRKQ